MNSRYRSFKLRFFSSDVINLRDVPLSYDKLTVSIIQSTISRNVHPTLFRSILRILRPSERRSETQNPNRLDFTNLKIDDISSHVSRRSRSQVGHS